MSLSLFIIGAGARVGWGIAQKFQAEGFKVALGSRSPDKEKFESNGFIPITVDASKTESIEYAFAEVTRLFGGAPNVVVYNAVSLRGMPRDWQNAFTVNAADFAEDASVNVIGAYTAVREATAGFKSIANTSVPKVFISTGNILPFKPMAIGSTLGTGKAAQAHLMAMAPLSYGGKGYRFYYASQVTTSGETVDYPELSGEAHGIAYWDLIQQKQQGMWKVNFTPDGKVYSQEI